MVANVYFTLRKILVFPFFQTPLFCITDWQIALQQEAGDFWRNNKSSFDDEVHNNDIYPKILIALTYGLLSDLENPTIHPVNITPHSFRVAVVRVEENPVPPQEFRKCVANRKSQFPDADSVQHAGVPQLTHAQLSVEHLEEVTATVKAPSMCMCIYSNLFQRVSSIFFLVKTCTY